MITIDIAYLCDSKEYVKTIECDYIREYKDHFLAVKKIEGGYLRWWINKNSIVYLCVLEREVRKNE